MSDLQSSSNATITEIYIKKVLPGSMESVRRQLLEAVEAVGYDIIEDEPQIIARRGSKGWGPWFGSADVTDYGSTLTLRLKSVSEHSTRVVFDYVINHPSLAKGDIAIVLQEANTIAAITKKQAVDKTCSVCETESTDDSRFCRQCGAPLTSELAELEVLRMMAETRAGKVSVFASTFLTPISLVFIILAIVLSLTNSIDPEALVILLIFGGISAILALIASLFGLSRLKNALGKPAAAEKQKYRHYVPGSIGPGSARELPPHQSPASVTEGTTRLLDDELFEGREREKVPVSATRETNEFD